MHNNRRNYTQDDIDHVIELHFHKSKSIKEIIYLTGINERSIRRWITRYTETVAEKTTVHNDNDEEKYISNEIVKLHKQVQRLNDKNRLDKKYVRENLRHIETYQSMTESLIDTIKDYKFNYSRPAFKNNDTDTESSPVSVIQFSDLHLNEVVRGLEGINEFNLEIACKRLKKHVSLSISEINAHKASKCILALTGDLVKNIQHLSEISENSMARSATTIIACDIMSQIIRDILEHCPTITQVYVSSVCGNESRMLEHIHDSNFLAVENFDYMIHKILEVMWSDSEHVTIIPINNPYESLLHINENFNMLMVHGNMHSNIARTASCEKQVESLCAKYAKMGTGVDYVIFGHIHQAYVSDNFARSGGLPGTDQYALRRLNLHGRASQNHYIVYQDGSIDGIKHDLQFVDHIKNEYTFHSFYDTIAQGNSVSHGVMKGVGVSNFGFMSNQGEGRLVNSYVI